MNKDKKLMQESNGSDKADHSATFHSAAVLDNTKARVIKKKEYLEYLNSHYYFDAFENWQAKNKGRM